MNDNGTTSTIKPPKAKLWKPANKNIDQKWRLMENLELFKKFEVVITLVIKLKNYN